MGMVVLGCGDLQIVNGDVRPRPRASGCPWHSWSCSLLERPNGFGFVVFNIEDGIKFGDLQQIVDLFGELEQLQFAALVTHRGKRAHQLPDARAIDIADVAQVEQNFLLPFAEKVFDGIAQYHAAFAQGYAAAHIDDSHAVHLTIVSLHCHCVSSLEFAVLRLTCLTNVISVPGSALRNLTSSIKARIRKMPRPEPFMRFSGARGSGINAGSRP